MNNRRDVVTSPNFIDCRRIRDLTTIRKLGFESRVKIISVQVG